MAGQLDGELLLLDFMNFSSVKIKAPRRAECRAPGCAHIREIAREEPGIEIASGLAGGGRRRAASKSSISAPRRNSRRSRTAAAHPHVHLLADPGLLVAGREFLLVCASGKRSLATARELRKRGLAVHSLAGGLASIWSTRRVRFNSKLPDVGTTIFTVMSRRALEEGALNIGQGFPDYPIDPRLAQAARSR